MGWQAREVADALHTSVSAVNSSLHRARAIASGDQPPPQPADLSPADHELLERYLRAWVAGDAEAVAALLSAGATFSMPPNPAWLRGRREVRRFLERVVLGPSRLTRRFVWTRANGAPAFGVYTRRAGERGAYAAHALQVLRLSRGRVAEIVSFHGGSVFPFFALPPETR